MKRIILAIPLSLAACGGISEGPRIGPGDLTDAATTAYGLSQGFVEANPVLAPAGDFTPLVMLGVKYGVKELLITKDSTPEHVTLVNGGVEAFGFGASLWNIMTIAGSSINPAFGLVIGAAGYFVAVQEGLIK